MYLITLVQLWHLVQHLSYSIHWIILNHHSPDNPKLVCNILASEIFYMQHVGEWLLCSVKKVTMIEIKCQNAENEK